MVPVPNQPGHQPICGIFQLAPGLYTNAYIPTVVERHGEFSDFSDSLVDPFTGVLFPGGVIPVSRFEGQEAIYAWRISAVTSGTDTVHTTLVLANSLAYTYDSGTVDIYANVVKATHGQTVGEVLGNGDSSQAFQKFPLHQKPLTYLAAATPSGAQSTLDTTVNEIDWQEAGSFAAMGPNDHEYITQTDNSDQTTVVFGNGTFGARVPSGTANVKAVYRYGIGSPGNVDAGQISQLATHPLGAQGVINPLPATGGADRDTADQARRNTPLAVMALDRLVSVRDYADFSRNFAGIGKAASARLSDGRRQLVHVTIAGAEDIPIDTTSDLYQNLVQALHQFGDPNLPILVALRKVKVLVISAGVRVLPDYHFESVEPQVRAALQDYFSFDRRELGQTAFLSEAVSVIQGVEGVSYSNITVFDSVADDIQPAQLAALGGTLYLRSYVQANLAQVDTTVDLASVTNLTLEDLWRRFKPAELVFLNPSIQDTLILTEITATNPGPPPATPPKKIVSAPRPVAKRTSVVYPKPAFPAGGAK